MTNSIYAFVDQLEQNNGRTQEYLLHSWWFVSRNEAVSE
ncbi:unnamed protein product [Brassica rapa subsp. trilocularis]